MESSSGPSVLDVVVAADPSRFMDPMDREIALFMTKIVMSKVLIAKRDVLLAQLKAVKKRACVVVTFSSYVKLGEYLKKAATLESKTPAVEPEVSIVAFDEKSVLLPRWLPLTMTEIISHLEKNPAQVVIIVTQQSPEGDSYYGGGIGYIEWPEINPSLAGLVAGSWKPLFQTGMSDDSLTRALRLEQELLRRDLKLSAERVHNLLADNSIQWQKVKDGTMIAEAKVVFLGGGVIIPPRRTRRQRIPHPRLQWSWGWNYPSWKPCPIIKKLEPSLAASEDVKSSESIVRKYMKKDTITFRSLDGFHLMLAHCRDFFRFHHIYEANLGPDLDTFWILGFSSPVDTSRKGQPSIATIDASCAEAISKGKTTNLPPGLSIAHPKNEHKSKPLSPTV